MFLLHLDSGYCLECGPPALSSHEIPAAKEILSDGQAVPQGQNIEAPPRRSPLVKTTPHLSSDEDGRREAEPVVGSLT